MLKTLRTFTSTEGDGVHYRFKAKNADEITARLKELREEANEAGAQCSTTSPRLFPDGLYYSAAWIDPIR